MRNLKGVWDGQFAFQGGRGGEAETFADVFGFQIRVFGEYLKLSLATCKETQDGRDRDAQPAETGDSAHFRGIDGDAVEVPHGVSRDIVAGAEAGTQGRGDKMPV
jgi:hypothetical protein